MDFDKIEYTPEQVKEIKEFFKENDITANSSLDAEIDISPDKADIFNRTKKIFAQYWKDNLKSLGINKSMNNFSKDHPVNFLMNVDGNILSEVIAELYGQLNVESDVDFIDAFCGMYQKPLMIGVERYAKKLGKTSDDLTDEELIFVVDKVAGIIIEEILKVVMIGQQVPELYDVSRKSAVIEDFNENQKENHPKIDFLRKQYGLKRKFDSVLSFDELAEEDLVNLNFESDFEQISDEEIDKAVAAFIDTLDDVERTIYFMKQDGCTQEEIAKALGYKTHSAVTKRLAKMKEKAIRYCESIDF